MKRSRTEYSWTGSGWRMTDSPVYYIYDGWRVVQERHGVDYTAYTRGADLSGSLEGAGGIGGLLARSTTTSGSGVWTNHAFYFADGNGNVTSMTDTNQAVVASYRYDPFGRTISSSGTLAAANVYRFSSKEIHVFSGMYYYGYRFYDPNLQRWLNRDPIGEIGGVNLYRFARNCALNEHDALGLMSPACAAAMQALADASANYEAAPGPLTFEVLMDAIDDAEAACGSDLPPMPPPTPVTDPFPACRPKPSPYRNPPGPPPPHRSFCDNHPAICHTVKAVGDYCSSHPITCASGVIIIIAVVPKPVPAF